MAPISNFSIFQNAPVKSSKNVTLKGVKKEMEFKGVQGGFPLEESDIDIEKKDK